MASPQRQRALKPAVDLGDEDPLYTRNLSNGPPDRRRVSMRWLAGSVLTGIFSAAFVGGALQAAIGLDENLIVRPAFASETALGDGGSLAEKGDRFRPVPESEVTRRVIKISTVTRSDDGRDIVRVRGYAHVHTNLAAPVTAEITAALPGFSPLDIFSDGGEAEDEAADGGEAEIAASDSIYGAEVDGEVAIKVEDFPLQGAIYDETAVLGEAEVAQMVAEAAPFLSAGELELSSLAYIDPARFDVDSSGTDALSATLSMISEENVTPIEKSDEGFEEFGVEDKVLPVTEGAVLRKMLMEEGATEEEATQIQYALVANFEFTFRAGQVLRVGLAPDPDTGALQPIRVSLYESEAHIATVALSDNGLYVAAAEPDLDAEMLAVEEPTPVPQPGGLPTVYAGLWGTGLTLEMPESLISKLVHIFAYDVDYQSRLAASDALEVIYSVEGEDGTEEGAEILYAALTLGSTTHRFYRFRSAEDGSVDYYDEEGKSAQRFLMRKPIAGGRFSSPFGMRRHPILRRYRMHAGVDWAAPSGTPIMAAGNGTVESIGTRSSYGRSIILRHTNGYETTYNHMSGYARGLDEGDRVNQGQVIGYVGSTGLSTGPHLHFEVLVNDRFVDPMKIRLPRGRELQGAELAAFEQERIRIDELVVREDSVASSE